MYRSIALAGLLVGLVTLGVAQPAQGAWGVNVGVGVSRPTCYYSPCYYYYPAPTVVYARPVYVPPPVYVTPQEPTTQPQTVVVYGKAADYLTMLTYGDTGDRKKAAKELKNYNSPVVVSSLIGAMQSDPNDGVRKNAAKSLGSLRAPDALPALRSAAVYDPKDDVRDAARDAAKKIEKTYGWR